MNNYSKKRELENQRLDMFDEAIELYNGKDFDSALIVFEEVAALEPKNYMGDDSSQDDGDLQGRAVQHRVLLLQARQGG